MNQPETRIDEVIDGIYRIASWSPDYGITFNQFLRDDERPALIHTGTHQIYENVRSTLVGSALSVDLNLAGWSYRGKTQGFKDGECWISDGTSSDSSKRRTSTTGTR